jgi:serine/threonine protein kinase
MNAGPTFHLPNFEVVGLLGRGGMASVWKARQISLDRFVAVKILSSAFATDPRTW